MRSPPRVGITTDRSYDVAEYEQAVRQAGGEPVRLLPERTRGGADLDGLHALIFSGGEDIDPARYGATAHAKTETAPPERDDYELALFAAGLERALPTLAICRGLQIANVALGGSLHQHVPDVFGTGVDHSRSVEGRTYRGLIDEHRLTISARSRLARIAGDALVTGSRHHQAVDRVAESLRVVARAPDGVIEALELIDAPQFWLAVQWHPESTVGLDGGKSAALFAALVDAAKDHLSTVALSRGP